MSVLSWWSGCRVDSRKITGALEWSRVLGKERMKMPIDINRNEVQRLIESGSQLIDVLPAEEYAESHLPGAINLPLKQLNKQTIKPLNPSHPVITYCNDFQ